MMKSFGIQYLPESISPEVASHPDIKTRRYAIVGAGAAGLCAIKYLKQAGAENIVNSYGPAAGDAKNFIAARLPAQTARDVSRHEVSNQQYDLARDGQCAHVETYFAAALRPSNNPQIEIGGGRYTDRFICRGGEWRIATRVVILDWQGVADAAGSAARMAQRHQGARDRTGPTYERRLPSRDAIEAA